MNTIRTLFVLAVSMFFAIPGMAQEVNVVKSEICQPYAESVVRVGSRLAETLFPNFTAEDLNDACDQEIKDAAVALKDSREDFDVDGDVITFYSRNQPQMTVYASQISLVGGIYQVQDLDVYLVEVLLATNDRQRGTRFSVFTDLGRAVEARDQMRNIVTQSIDQSVASITPLLR